MNRSSQDDTSESNFVSRIEYSDSPSPWTRNSQEDNTLESSFVSQIDMAIEELSNSPSNNPPLIPSYVTGLRRSENYYDLSDNQNYRNPSGNIIDSDLESNESQSPSHINNDIMIRNIFNDHILYKNEQTWVELFENYSNRKVLFEKLLHYAEIHYKKNLNVELPISYYYEKYSSPLAFIPRSLENDFVKYMEEKIGFEFNKDLFHRVIMEYIYFRESPTGKFGDVDRVEDEVKINNNIYRWHYFMWICPDDPNLQQAPESTVFTPQTMTKYNLTNNFGWSVKQIRTYYNATVLPYILQKYLPTINPNQGKYKNLILKFYPTKKIMVYIIKEFVKNNNSLQLNQDYINSSFQYIQAYKTITGSSRPTNVYEKTYQLLENLKYIQVKIQESLNKKLLKIKTRVEEQSLPEKYKYKWERMCAKLTKLDLEELRELALIEDITFVHMKSKRELCKELYEKIDQMVADLSTYTQQCQNDFSVLTSDNVPKNLQDIDQPDFIKSQYLFTYKHNGLVYCDDIRALYKYINESGRVWNRTLKKYEYMHPDTRSALSESNVRAIERTYNNLLQKIITLHDNESDATPDMTPQQILSAFSTTFSSKLMTHAKNIQLYINSDQNAFQTFLTSLKLENILSQNEIDNIQYDLINQKLALARHLTLKIDNDTVVTNGVPFSGMSAIVAEIYNETF